ncbi:MAG: hypothetical protein ACKERG_00880 [Candidatus Hodgkinia cicadicola]
MCCGYKGVITEIQDEYRGLDAVWSSSLELDLITRASFGCAETLKPELADIEICLILTRRSRDQLEIRTHIKSRNCVCPSADAQLSD